MDSYIEDQNNFPDVIDGVIPIAKVEQVINILF